MDTTKLLCAYARATGRASAIFCSSTNNLSEMQMAIMGIPKGDHPVSVLVAEKVMALLNAELATVMSNSYRRGMVDQFYQPLSEEAVIRIRRSMEEEGITDPSWPPLPAPTDSGRG